MEFYKRDFLISRIRCGYIPIDIDKKRILVYHPNANLSLRSNEIYIKAREEAVDQELLSDNDVCEILIAMDLWSDKQEEELTKTVPGHIEYWKIELYRNINKSNTKKTIRKYLEVAKKELVKLYNVRHSFDHITIDGYANYVKSMFIISNCARYKNKKVDWQIFDLNKTMNIYHSSILNSDIIRILARTTPWSGIWSTAKINGKIFDNSYLTSEQQTLISWSSMYDKIYESSECPSDEVIDDDDLLDGWLLIQKKKREVDRKKQEIDKITNNKINNADDVFIIAETPEDALKIDLLNDNRSIDIKKQRLNEIKERGNVLEQQLGDIKRRRSMEIQRAYVNKVKGK